MLLISPCFTQAPISIVNNSQGYDANLGATGGEPVHTIDADENAIHSHGYRMDVFSASGGNNRMGAVVNPAATIKNGFAPLNSFVAGGRSGTFFIENSGGGQAHNNMPPYLALAYIIKI